MQQSQRSKSDRNKSWTVGSLTIGSRFSTRKRSEPLSITVTSGFKMNEIMSQTLESEIDETYVKPDEFNTCFDYNTVREI